jgi:hypothetical protein
MWTPRPVTSANSADFMKTLGKPRRTTPVVVAMLAGSSVVAGCGIATAEHTVAGGVPAVIVGAR